MFKHLTSNPHSVSARPTSRSIRSFLGSTRSISSLPRMERRPAREAPVTKAGLFPINPKDVKEVIEIGKAVYNEVTPKPTYNGVFSLLILNLAMFLIDHVLGASNMILLYLNHAAPQWWQFITCTFMHSSWQHLSNNIFMIYVFGKIIEEEGGAVGLWLTYLVCGLGGSLAAYLFTPVAKAGILGLGGKAVVYSLGASGAVFGLFITSVVLKLQWNWRKLLEALILGQFVLGQVLGELKNQVAVGAAGAVSSVSHVGHLGGALAGVAMLIVMSRIAGKSKPDPPSRAAQVVKTINKML